MALPSAARCVLVDEFNDAAVSGADPIETRRGFAALLDRIESNGVRTVIVEDASRFARELVTQELGIIALIKRGVRVLTANGDDLTDSSDPSRKMMRQIAGAFSEYEKTRLVAKLRAARERKRAVTGKCEGRKSWAEAQCGSARRAAPRRASLSRRSAFAAAHRRGTNARCVTSLPNWRGSATSTSAVRCSPRRLSSRSSIAEKSPDRSAVLAADVEGLRGPSTEARNRAAKYPRERARIRPPGG